MSIFLLITNLLSMSLSRLLCLIEKILKYDLNTFVWPLCFGKEPIEEKKERLDASVRFNGIHNIWRIMTHFFAFHSNKHKRKTILVNFKSLLLSN